ncbi:MAG TPA: hypothetical protein VG146_22890 [Verrucomicrobiae bacterium]|nr:hypothetical protein [Verrucomicrobiae bacterium]
MKVIPAIRNSDPRSQQDPAYFPPLLLKIPQQYFTNSWGDIFVTRAGENGKDVALFIVHWDNARGTFSNTKIPYGNQGAPFYGEYIEHGAPGTPRTPAARVGPLRWAAASSAAPTP